MIENVNENLKKKHEARRMAEKFLEEMEGIGIAVKNTYIEKIRDLRKNLIEGIIFRGEIEQTLNEKLKDKRKEVIAVAKQAKETSLAMGGLGFPFVPRTSQLIIGSTESKIKVERINKTWKIVNDKDFGGSCLRLGGMEQMDLCKNELKNQIELIDRVLKNIQYPVGHKKHWSVTYKISTNTIV